ncbi:MAG: hypothetical protein ACYCRE_01995 [Acidobacteriaceae bacterium]
MNSLHCFLHWLFPSGAAVAEWVAAFATGCLVGAGFIQLKAIRKGAEEQRAHWKREDELRAEENRPKPVFWLEPKLDNYSFELCCANVGTVNFLVTNLLVDPIRSERIEISIDECGQSVVSVGGPIWRVRFDARKIFAQGFTANAEVSLCLQGPSGLTATNAEAYSFYFKGDRYEGLRRGFANYENVFCPKCKKHCRNLRLLGMNFKSDCLKEIAGVEKDFEQTCPNHASANSRVISGT